MNLGKKKELAKRTLGVGKERIAFAESRLEDIKEAITKQDIKDLYSQGAIVIKPKKGRRKVVRKKSRSVGNVRIRVNKRKREYIAMVRKQRRHIAELKKRGELAKEEHDDLRKKIRNKVFRSKAHLKEHIGGLKK